MYLYSTIQLYASAIPVWVSMTLLSLPRSFFLLLLLLPTLQFDIFFHRWRETPPTFLTMSPNPRKERDGLGGNMRVRVMCRWWTLLLLLLAAAAEGGRNRRRRRKKRKERRKEKEKIPAAISGLMVEIKEEVEEEEEVYSGGGGIKRRQQQRILPKAKKRISPHCLSLSLYVGSRKIHDAIYTEKYYSTLIL